MRLRSRKTVLHRALLIGASGALTITGAQIGCSSPGAGPSESALGSPSSGSADATGTVGMQLTLPGGEQISTIHWTLTGPNGASTVVQTGSVDVANSLTISFLIGGVPAGSSYSIVLTGTSTDGTVTCTGSAVFNMVARTTTNVNVALQCNTPPQEAGSALINGSTFNCATWTSLSATPSETTVGTSVSIGALATGPNPGALTYAWSAPSGSFSNAASGSTSFTCTAPGPVTLTVTASDGPVPAGSACNPALSTSSLTVQCDGHVDQAALFSTATKIKHLVVIFNENNSYDHYFATYPSAQNNPGDTPFLGSPGTPTPNNLSTPLNPTSGFSPVTGVNLLASNPTASNAANGTGAVNPFRLAASQAATEDMNHNYMPEQQADDNGAMDLFPKYTGTAGPPPDAGPVADTKGLVMAYYDGNTMGTYWGWAQTYAMNDNSWTTNFGPSTPGAINVISGQTNGIATTNHLPLSSSHAVADGNGGLTLIGDVDPLGDVCSSAADQVTFGGLNIGNLLNTKAVSWGWFEGGFDLGITNANGTTGCARETPATVAGFFETSTDYIPHHAPFQYYPSTANPTHARPASVAAIGTPGDTVANHNYDTTDFFAALSAGNLPAVVYLKAPAYQDGHPGYSDPVDEQAFAASVVSALQAAQEWSSTAVVIDYDDSDGWYDHQEPPIVNPSTTVDDALNGPGLCVSGAQQNGAAPTTPLLGIPPADGGAAAPAQGRCGYGTRVPMMVISPFAKHNYVDHTLTDQSSIVKFIEDNWLSGQRIQPGGSFDTIAGTIQNMLTGI